MSIDHPKVRKQAETPQNASRDDQHCQSNEDPCHGSRNATRFPLHWHGWF
jgi:hypothetical protein